MSKAKSSQTLYVLEWWIMYDYGGGIIGIFSTEARANMVKELQEKQNKKEGDTDMKLEVREVKLNEYDINQSE